MSSSRPGLVRLVFVLAIQFAGMAVAQLPGVPRVQSGMRVTFYSSSASVRGTNQQAVLNPNCNPAVEDCWTDPNTGQKIGLQDVPTASGQGYNVVDIVYLDAQTCVMRLTLYLLDPADGRVTTAGTAAEVTNGGSCSDYWIDPVRLQQMQEQSTPTLRVLRGPYTVGDLTVQALVIASRTASGHNNSAYDAASGLLVVGSSRAQGAGVPTITPGNMLTTGAGNTMLTYTQILGARVLAGVGALEPLPPHVLNANRLVYDCTNTSIVAGVGAMETPCRLETTLGQRTEFWALTMARFHTPDPITGGTNVSEASNVIVGGGHGSFYASPTVLAGLRAGAALDVDPVTGIRTTVTYVDDAVVAIVEESNAERRTFAYDKRSGWLIQYVIEQNLVTGATVARYDLVTVE